MFAKKIIISACVPILIFSFLCLPSTHAENNGGSFVPNEVLVKYKKQKVSVIQVGTNKTVESTIAELRQNNDVEYVEPNYIRNITTISTNDTHRALLWGLDNTGQEIDGDWGIITGTADADIDAPEAWAISEGDNADVIVAVIDNGVSYTHPDLTANMWDGTNCVSNLGVAIGGGCNHGYDYRNSDVTPLPLSSDVHGTHVAGIIGAVKDNSLGVIGVAPHVKIMAIRFNLNVSTEVKAIDFAIQNGAKVINASFGGPDFSQAEYDAIERFKDAGGIFIAAAGNDATSNEITHNYPSDYDLSNIISVAATDQNDDLAEFSNFGATSVDVAAPGENILSTITGNIYEYLSGTSMATPYTAGLAALVWGYKNELSADEVKGVILNDGDSLATLDGATVSGKRINADRSLFGADIIYTQSVHDDAVEGVNPDEYSTLVRATLQTAIDTATTVKNNVSATEADIASAVSTLDAAVLTFLAARNPADFTALDAAIVSAQALHDGAVESTTPGDYVIGSKVILQTAIDAASAVEESALQSVVDAAVESLNTAVDTFSSSIVPEDTTPPVITLLGDSSVTVKLGAVYTDDGATASDNVDGDITENIVVVDPVDTAVAGTYTVTYNVSDLASNPAEEVSRTVIVRRSSGGGGGGGGGGSSSEPETVSTAIPAIPTVPVVKTEPVAIPSDCQTNFLFSPLTGKPCTTGNPADPARYLFQNSAPTICVINIVLKQGMKNDQVKCMQNILKIPADGIFGPKTKASVIIFQSSHNLTPDGVVGEKTRGAMGL